MDGQGQAERIKLDELFAKYPPDKYISVLPNLFLAEGMPEHITFGVNVFEISPLPDGDEKGERSGETWWLDKPKDAWKSDDGKKSKPAEEGWLGLTKVALQKFDVALGLKWIPDYCRRIDDGRNPDICGYAAAAMLAGISGANVETGEYWLDLANDRELYELKLREYPPKGGVDAGGTWQKWDRLPEARRADLLGIMTTRYYLQRRANATRICETGARLRVIRNFIALPQRFRPSILKSKKFAVLTPVFDPKPQSEGERIALMADLSARFLPAFGVRTFSPTAPPAGRALGAGEVVERPALPEGRGGAEIPVAIEAETGGFQLVEVEDGSPEGGGGDRGATGKIEAPVPDPGLAAELERFKREVSAFEKELVELMGDEAVDGFFAELHDDYALDSFASASAGERAAIIVRLKGRLDEEIARTAKAGTPEPPAEDPDGWLLKSRRTFLEKKDVATLRKTVNELIAAHKYDMKTDPKGLRELFVAGKDSTKEQIIEGALRLIKYGLDAARAGNK